MCIYIYVHATFSLSFLIAQIIITYEQLLPSQPSYAASEPTYALLKDSSARAMADVEASCWFSIALHLFISLCFLMYLNEEGGFSFNPKVNKMKLLSWKEGVAWICLLWFLPDLFG